MVIKVKVLYFGQAKDASGRAEEVRSLPERTTLRTMMEAIFSLNPKLEGMAKAVQVAVNEEIAVGDRSLKDGDVIAVLPPVAGG